MAEYNNEMRGGLWKNKGKSADNHPDYTGNVTIDEKKWELAAWIETSKKGETYMSIKVSEPWNPEGGDNGKKEAAPAGTVAGEEIPF